VDAGLPVQLHTGFGDPEEDLHRANPALLAGFCRATEHTGTAIVLLHCYPYHREAAYLAAVYPGAFMDLSLAIPLAAADGARALAEALGLCPWSKLLYATDASRLPELYFVAATRQREALATALAGLVDDGFLSQTNLLNIVRQTTPVTVANLAGAVQVAVGLLHACALTVDGGV